jgi:hypothetical protein
VRRTPTRYQQRIVDQLAAMGFIVDPTQWDGEQWKLTVFTKTDRVVPVARFVVSGGGKMTGAWDPHRLDQRITWGQNVSLRDAIEAERKAHLDRCRA